MRGLEVRSRDVPGHVHEASLDPHTQPARADGGQAADAAVANHHVAAQDAAEQGEPGVLPLRVTPGMPKAYRRRRPAGTSRSGTRRPPSPCV